MSGSLFSDRGGHCPGCARFCVNLPAAAAGEHPAVRPRDRTGIVRFVQQAGLFQGHIIFPDLSGMVEEFLYGSLRVQIIVKPPDLIGNERANRERDTVKTPSQYRPPTSASNPVPVMRRPRFFRTSTDAGMRLSTDIPFFTRMLSSAPLDTVPFSPRVMRPLFSTMPGRE